MADVLDYAQLSSRVYNTDFPGNRTPVSQGWEELYWQVDTTTGFSAGAYRKGNEIVISFTGTNQAKFADFVLANIPLGTGTPSPQLDLAVAFYEGIKFSYANSDTKITFTGHSLGGGLASLMGIFFNKEAVIFDPAPFGLSAFGGLTPTGLTPDVPTSVKNVLSSFGFIDPDFEKYIVLTVGNQSVVDSFEYARRVKRINGRYLQGEALQYLRAIAPTVVNNLSSISTGDTDLGTVGLHSMTLLSSFLISPAFAAAAKTMPRLLPALFDTTLFNVENEKNLLAHLYRHQVGVYDNTIGVPQITPDRMLDRFGLDLAKIVDSKLIYTDLGLAPALIKLGLQHYYLQDTTQVDLFKTMGGGIQFDLTKPLGDIDTALGEIKAYNDLKDYTRVATLGEAAEVRDAISTFIADKRRWTVAQGNTGINGTAEADNTADFVLGGTQNDFFKSGGGDDLLVGAGGELKGPGSHSFSTKRFTN